MFHIAIVEDDQQYAAQIEHYLERFAKERELELRIAHFPDGMELVEQYNPIYDIIFLDIEMPHLDGMSAAEYIRKKDGNVILIFITNLAQYAIRGYGVNALDYVLKPISYPAFALKLQKACRILEKRDTRSVILSEEGESWKLPVSDIHYVEVADHRLVYHTAKGVYRSFGSLRTMEGQLGEGFARCNSCYLVNLSYVDGVRDDSVLVRGDALKISRNRKKAFMQQFSDYCRFGGR